MARTRWLPTTLSLVLVAPLAWVSCSDDGTDGDAPSSGTDSGSGANGPGSTGQFATGSGGGGPCEGLECQQVSCPGGGTTTLSGRVFEPAGKVPLYNVLVYVPNAPLADIPTGASCDQCGSVSGSPIVTALTDASGSFVLENVPVGADIPLVVQVGKWRRQITIPSVAECVDNPLSDGTTRLPRNQAEGHIPKIALTTGGADPLECLLRKVGIDESEFTNPGGSGRVNYFAGDAGTDRYADALNGGADFPNATSLWDDVGSLSAYDLVLLACEGGQNEGDKPNGARQAMLDYASAGGRIFASHWHNIWIDGGPDPWPTVASFDFQEDLPSPFTARIDDSFPKGVALRDWLVNVGGSQTPGELVIVEGQHTVNAVNPATSTRWIYGENPDSVQYFTFNTPVGAAEEDQCGRVVLSDIHVSSGDQIDQPFPQGCQTNDLSPQELALLFMLFDLSSCLTPDDQPPVPPPPE